MSHTRTPARPATIRIADKLLQRIAADENPYMQFPSQHLRRRRARIVALDQTAARQVTDTSSPTARCRAPACPTSAGTAC